MFTIYSKPNCTWCDRAKALLTSKGKVYEEFVLDVGQQRDPKKSYVSVDELKAVVPNAQSVPQILFDNELVGGFSDLQKMLG